MAPRLTEKGLHPFYSAAVSSLGNSLVHQAITMVPWWEIIKHCSMGMCIHKTVPLNKLSYYFIIIPYKPR
jgi:hypothetical protein